jgi:ubiquinone/menaquinone biosynthesis C-methylase UbiE
MQSWLSYWDAPNQSYVNERHKQAHYDVVFEGIRPYLPPGPGRVVLDWGCGDALAAERIADVSGAVLLYDPATSTRNRLHQLHGACPRVRILDDSAADALAANSIDLVIVNSVIQYLTRQQLAKALTWFHHVLKPGGELLLGDVISPGTPTLRHVTTFLRFAMRRGFLLPAAVGLASIFVSPYRKLQREVGLAVFAPGQTVEMLTQHGFAAERLPSNIAVSSYRSSYIARKPPWSSEHASARSAADQDERDKA